MVVYCCHAYVALSYRKDSYGFESSDSASHEKVKLGKKLLGAELCSAATREQWLWVRHAARVDMLLEATGNLRFLHFCGVIHNICIWVGRMLQYLHVFWGGNCDITTVCNRNLSWCLNEAGGYLCDWRLASVLVLLSHALHIGNPSLNSVLVKLWLDILLGLHLQAVRKSSKNESLCLLCNWPVQVFPGSQKNLLLIVSIKVALPYTSPLALSLFTCAVAASC